MPTVLCLGGTGQFGLPIARHLGSDPIAGRDLAKAQAAVAAGAHYVESTATRRTPISTRPPAGPASRS